MIMNIYLDTANVKEIKEAVSQGSVDGITTNPSLAAKEGRDFKELVLEICNLVDGPISAEVISVEADAIVKEGRELAKLHKNIVVKCPLIPEGLKATKRLTAEGIRVNVTLCFSPTQALLAAKAGAWCVSPFIGRLDDISSDGMELIRQITARRRSGISRRPHLHYAVQRLSAADQASLDRHRSQEVSRRLERTTPKLAPRARGSAARHARVDFPASPRFVRIGNDPSRPLKHLKEHRGGQFSGERILLARMVGADERHPPGQSIEHAMPKAKRGRGHGMTQFATRSQILVERNLSKSDDDAVLRQQAQLFQQVGTATIELIEGRFIVGRRTPHHSRYIAIGEHKTVILPNRLRLVGKSVAVQRVVEPVSTSIAGKDSPGAVAAMRRRRQADDEQTGGGIPKSWHRTTPVDPFTILTAFHRRDSFPIGHQPGTVSALSDRLIHCSQRAHGRGVYHNIVQPACRQRMFLIA
jgi:TalC/MipB family fructose-6-phosphate aldolase